MRRAQNTVKRGGFWRPGWSPAGGAAPLSYGEERNAFGYATARGPLAGFMRLTPDSRAPAKADPSARAGVGVVVGVVVVVVCCCCCCCCLLLVVVVVVGVVVGRCWPYLGAGLPLSWPSVGPCSPHLGVMSTQVAHILADVGPILAYVVPILALCRPM